ncbi:major facilitator superfamily domain-containing protein [Pestalotiopsis sp. NC0098]|nr:major facilitator superfamily domain-containing protein [Pestalotiopsis sp. NC0098]
MHEESRNSVPQADQNEAVADLIQHHDLPKEDAFAWLQTLGAFVLNLNTWGLMNAYGAFQTFYQLDFLSAHSSSQIAWIGSTQAFLLFLVSIVAGPVFDAGHLRSLLWTGSAALVIGAFLVSITRQYYQVLLTQGILMGLGLGCLYLPAPAVVSQYFDKHAALAIGAPSTGSALGGVIYPIMFSQLEPRIGFGWATRVIAFVILGTSLIPVMAMKSRSEPHPLRNYNLVDREAFRDAPYFLLNLGLFFGFMGLYIIFYYIELFALERTDSSTTLSKYLLVIINGSSLAGRLIPGYYADKIGSVNVQASVALLSAILTFCLLAIKTAPSLIVFSVFYGFSAGAFMGLPAASIVTLSADKSKIGTRIGMTLAFVGFGVLVSNPIAGSILGVDQNWLGLIVWCGVLLIASALCLITARILKTGPRLLRLI